METRERNLINYQELSPRLSFSSPTTRIETLDHLHQKNNYHGFKLQREKPLLPDPDPQPQPLPPAPPPSTTVRPAAVVRYLECLKNHAANRGAHVVDGCGEFMPGGEDNTPEALKCAACDCHRNFHRREVEGESQSSHMAPPLRATPVQLPPAPSTHQQHRRYSQPMPPVMMAFGGANGAPAESSSEDFNVFQTYAGAQLMARASKKRFRTKFSQEQKEKMFDFAERIGWKIQKQDEEEVLSFCNEVGLKRQVFKVWMHNNKQAAKKK